MLNGIYRGEVISRSDPLKAGRCQVRIYPAFEGVADGDLPWAIQADPLMGGYPAIGGSFIPVVGAFVWCFFENGDPRYPVYFAGAPAMFSGTPDIPPDTQTNYPYRKIYRSETGTEILIDDTSGDTRFQITMENGFSLSVDDGGDVTENVPGNVNVTISGNSTINVTGNVDVSVTGTTAINGTGAMTVTGADTITVTAPTVNVTGT